MDDNKDFCPVNASGDHRYFIFKAMEVFLPYEDEDSVPIDKNLYEKKEKVILGCNCGAALSKLIEVKRD
jgi:hypothetical protein